MIKKIIAWFRLQRDIRRFANGAISNHGWHITENKWEIDDREPQPCYQEPFIRITYHKVDYSEMTNERAESIKSWMDRVEAYYVLHGEKE